MILIGSFHTITSHGSSGTAASCVSGRSTSAGAVEPDDIAVIARSGSGRDCAGGARRYRRVGSYLEGMAVQRQVETDSCYPKTGHPGQVEFHDPGGVVQEVLQVAEGALDDHYFHEQTSATQYDLWCSRVMKGELGCQGQADEEQGDRRVGFGYVSEGYGDPLGAGAPGVGARTRDDRAQQCDQA